MAPIDNLRSLKDNGIPLPRNKHRSNKNSIRVTELINSRAADYQSAKSRSEKSNIIAGVLDQIAAERLEFMEWEEATSNWRKQEKKESHKNVQKCLSELQTAINKKKNHSIAKEQQPVGGTGAPKQQQPVEGTATRDSSVSRPGLNPKIIFINSNSLSWNETNVTREFLDNLEKAMTSKIGLRHLLKQANDEGNKSITKINRAVEIFLTKGRASAYQSLKNKLPKSNQQGFVDANELVTFLKISMSQHPHLKNYNLKNPAILLGFEENSGPQPKHCDTVYRKNSSEKVGILMLSSGANGTIYYDMSDIRRADSQEYPLSLNELQKIWVDAPKSLFHKLQDQGALELLQQYGGLLFATPGKRIEPGVVEQHSTLIIDGCNPHCAPAHGNTRAVIFFALEPRDFDGESYEGDTQMSHEKLCLMLYEKLHDQLELKEKVFLLREFISAIEESAKLGASDETINLGETHNPILEALREKMASVHKKELLSSEKEKKLILLDNKLEQANKERGLAMKKWKQGKRNAFIDLDKYLPEFFDATATFKEACDEYRESVRVVNEERHKLDGMKEHSIYAIIGTDFTDSFLEGK